MRRYGRTRFEKYDTDGYIKAARARENLVADAEIQTALDEMEAQDDWPYCWCETCQGPCEGL
jgi:hypothetical protein